MAAGIGSRFGGGIKQLEPVGPSGEIIMDYSIHDALEAGFNKVVFIIRKDLEKDFREIIGNRMEKLVETAYAFQEIDDLPAGFTKPADRTKPWGTGQAILSCKDLVNEPFAVTNADDYYGKEAFVKVHDYLVEEHPASDKLDFCMAGFLLENTLSENGGVTRGICQIFQLQISVVHMCCLSIALDQIQGFSSQQVMLIAALHDKVAEAYRIRTFADGITAAVPFHGNTLL